MKTWWGRRWGERKALLPLNSQYLPQEGRFSMTWNAVCFATNDAGGIPVPSLQVLSRLPLLYLNTSRAQEGEIVVAQCVLQKLVPAARIVFCKDGMEVHNMKAHQDTVIYSMLLNISARSSGTYACGYQQRNESNWLRRSPLSTPLDLHVTGGT